MNYVLVVNKLFIILLIPLSSSSSWHFLKCTIHFHLSKSSSVAYLFVWQQTNTKKPLKIGNNALPFYTILSNRECVFTLYKSNEGRLNHIAFLRLTFTHFINESNFLFNLWLRYIHTWRITCNFEKTSRPKKLDKQSWLERNFWKRNCTFGLEMALTT